MNVPPPEFLFIQINKRCNLRCQHCDFWKLDDDDRPRYLSRERRREVLGEFAAMRPGGAVVICGGESMLDLEDYFAIAGDSREFGLRCLSVINGTRVRDPERADRMVRSGPHEISVSLNSQRRELHDRTRGVKGAFDKAVKALRLLLEARARNHTDTLIYAMGLIFDENYREIDQFYDFVLNEVGADKLKLNFIQPSFGHGEPEDEFFANHYRVDPDVIYDLIGECDRKYDLGLNPIWREQVRMYFRSLLAAKDVRKGWSSRTGTIDHICSTYERNIMVDHYGVARLCFSTMFPGFPLKKVGDLNTFWQSAEFIRRAMRRCNQFCGISHSVRRETSTTASRRPIPVPVVAGSDAPRKSLFDYSFTLTPR
ncbi:MAG TPA: radical SAM protein [Casimicrobiaceae bacterium]|nr:radical SAM protein [Casimicrobiaceae bacterium]